MSYKILLVDDEADIINLLRDYFEINGYTVLTALNGQEAIKQTEKHPDLILLDITMPDMDGLKVCTQIRKYVSCPILFLTAKVEDSDKINGFRVGGDDYIIKPFCIDELGARVAEHLRREERHQVKSKTKFVGDLVIDYTSRTVCCQYVQLQFAKKEFDIIELLSMNSRQVFDKERIYERVWGWDSDGDSCVVAEHIRRIRVKLSEACSATFPFKDNWYLAASAEKNRNQPSTPSCCNQDSGRSCHWCNNFLYHCSHGASGVWGGDRR